MQLAACRVASWGTAKNRSSSLPVAEFAGIFSPRDLQLSRSLLTFEMNMLAMTTPIEVLRAL